MAPSIPVTHNIAVVATVYIHSGRVITLMTKEVCGMDISCGHIIYRKRKLLKTIGVSKYCEEQKYLKYN